MVAVPKLPSTPWHPLVDAEDQPAVAVVAVQDVRDAEAQVHLQHRVPGAQGHPREPPAHVLLLVGEARVQGHLEGGDAVDHLGSSASVSRM